MTLNASKQGKLDSFAAILLFIVLPCMRGLGFQNDSAIALGRTVIIWDVLCCFLRCLSQFQSSVGRVHGQNSCVASKRQKSPPTGGRGGIAVAGLRILLVVICLVVET